MRTVRVRGGKRYRLRANEQFVTASFMCIVRRGHFVNIQYDDIQSIRVHPRARRKGRTG